MLLDKVVKIRQQYLVKRFLGIIGGFIFILAVVATTNSAVAHHRQEVLGESTTASEVVFPPVTSGPGYILPDSPLFFLDQLSQVLRVSVAGNSTARVGAHKAIAGERMAELRIMFAKNNEAGINAALFGVASSMKSAADALTQAEAEGQDVQKLSQDLNDTLKLQRKTMAKLIEQSEGSLQLQLRAANKGLAEAKLVVEDNLPEDELAKEIEDSLRANVAEYVSETASLSKRLEADLDRLGHMASESAAKSLGRRAQALKEATDEKNAQLVAVQKKLLEEEEEKQEQLVALQSSASAEVKNVLGASTKAATNLQKTQDALVELQGQ